MTTFAAFAISQLTTNTSAGHALELGDSLTPNVLQSDKGSTTQRRKKASSPNALTRSMELSPAERQAKATAFHPRHASNFALDPVPSKVIPVAGRSFATA